MSIIEYNKKRAIFKYLQRLDKNGRGKMAASLKAAKIVFINAKKHQKTVRLINDEDIANRCKTWIRLQNDGVIPKAFKNFIENTLFVGMNITKKKTISLTTATRWLNILGFFTNNIIKAYTTTGMNYIGDDMKYVPPKLKDDEKEHVLITHNDC
ncbi:18244_t:CDS:2 [Funneliformis geosporum]|nr:18244_t:CDS:2 [Funneliformis geosporum]